MFNVKTTFEPSLLRDLLALNPGRSVAATVRSHVPDARVAQMLDHFTQYVGSAPDASPAVLCGIAHMQTSEGVWYPAGRHGGRASGTDPTGDRAGRRDPDRSGRAANPASGRRRCPGRRDGGGRDASRSMRSSPIPTPCGLTASCSEARQPCASSADARYEPACSGVVLYLGLDRRYDHLLHHNFVFSSNPEEEFEAIYRRGEPARRSNLLRLRPGSDRTRRRAHRGRRPLCAGPHALPPSASRLGSPVPRLSQDHPREAEPHGWIDRHRGPYSRRAAADPCRHPRALRRPEWRDLRHRITRALAGGLQAVQSQSGRQGPLPGGWRCAPRSGHADGPDVGMDRRGRARS